MDKPKGTKDTEGRFKGRFTLTVGDLNAKLDELVAAGGGRGIAVRQQGADNAAAAGKRAAVLRSLMQATTPTQMRWIVPNHHRQPQGKPWRPAPLRAVPQHTCLCAGHVSYVWMACK